MILSEVNFTKPAERNVDYFFPLGLHIDPNDRDLFIDGGLLPHHVIQGNGLRVTISCQLIFEDGNPVGVWEHIQKNIHLVE